jgi:oxygen-independent coproporphyrinogen-3 oxidase
MLKRDHRLLAKYDRPVPRYTSYPTAPHFHRGIGAEDYGGWLGALDSGATLSIYQHIPYCDSLCWFCGCHTKIVRRYEPIAAYVEALLGETDLVAARLPGRARVSHIHWGGGSPSMLSPADMLRIAERLRTCFAVDPEAEFAIEIDPRGIGDETIAAMAAAGINRVSVGVQDVDERVQRAVNRIQPFDSTRHCIRRLRAAGIAAINCDLMYGLPYQDTARVVASVQAVLELEPDRLALFGYAHVPHMKRHQKMIPEDELPDGEARLEQSLAAAARLEAAGYVRIGLDHFAHPRDSLARTAAQGRLHRNFQGYTTDRADALLGLGASAIGKLPQGYVQNAVAIRDYRALVAEGRLPTVRGIAVDEDDRLRGAVIERIMCDLEVDPAKVAADFGKPPGYFAPERAALAGLAADGLIQVSDSRIAVTEAGRPFVRQVAAVFDSYLDRGEARHSRAV